jgi:hypothetical protein
MFGHTTQLSFDLADELILGGTESEPHIEPLTITTTGRRRWPGIAVLAAAAVVSAIPFAERAFSVAPSAPAESTPPVVVPPVVMHQERERPHRPLRRHARPRRVPRRAQPAPLPPVTPTPPPPPAPKPVIPPRPRPVPETEFF